MHIYPLLPSQDQPEKSICSLNQHTRCPEFPKSAASIQKTPEAFPFFFPTVKLPHFPACQVQVIVAAFFAVLQALNKYSLLKKKSTHLLLIVFMDRESGHKLTGPSASGSLPKLLWRWQPGWNLI